MGKRKNELTPIFSLVRFQHAGAVRERRQPADAIVQAAVVIIGDGVAGRIGHGGQAAVVFAVAHLIVAQEKDPGEGVRNRYYGLK
jgi:hypothetical protein